MNINEVVEKPLVSLIVFAYNQEDYIKDAINSAFAQTYSRLEILLSDDCSGDSTFAIMEQMAKDYQGKHTIRLNRNPENLGIGAHFARATSLVKGEFIMIGAGDDISLPERTEQLVDCWLKSNKKALLVHSNAQTIAEDGKPLDLIRKPDLSELTDIKKTLLNNGCIIGATEGFSARLLKEFPPVNPDVVHEDRFLPLRALLLGSIGYINKPLVNYRVGGISYGYDKINTEEYLFGLGNKIAYRFVADYQQKIADLEYCGAADKLVNLAKTELARWQLIAWLGKERTFSFRLIQNALKQGVSPFLIFQNTAKYLMPGTYHRLVGWVKRD